MNVECLILPQEIPEWRRSGRFVLLATALHLAILFYPLKIALGLSETPPRTVFVHLAEPALPTPEPIQAPPEKPKPQPAPPQPVKKKIPRPVLAIAPEPTAPPAKWTAPVPPAVVESIAPITTPPARPTNPGPPAPLIAPRFDAAYLENPHPKYPPASRRLGEEGKVLLRVRVSPDGLPAAVNLEKSSNFERLDEAARQVVARWRFVPAKRGEQAIEASVIVPIVFRLES